MSFLLLPVYFRVSRHKKGQMVPEIKKYICWYLEQHHKENPGVRIVLIFDFTDAGVTNMVNYILGQVLVFDTDFKFQMKF